MNDAIVERVSGNINPIVSEFRDTTVCCLGENKAVRIKSDKKQAQCFVRENAEAVSVCNADLDFILPDGVRFFYNFPSKESKFFVVEQEPGIRTLNFSKEFFWEDKYCYNDHYKTSYSEEYPYLKRFKVQLAFPYVIFLIEISLNGSVDLHAYLSKRSLSFMNDPLYRFHLPNIYGGYEVCTYFDGFQNGHDTLSKKILYVMDDFWGSEFGTDAFGDYRIMQQKDKRFANVWEWEKNSLADPSFVLDVDRYCLCTLDEAISFFTPESFRQPFTVADRLHNFAIQYSEHTDNLTTETCSSIKTSKVDLSEADVKDFMIDVDEEKKRIASLKGLVCGARVRIRKDSRYYHQAPDIPGVISSDFDKYCRADYEYHWAYVAFDNGLKGNLYCRDDLEVIKE